MEDKRFINKDTTSLWISEVFGVDLPATKLHRYKREGDYLFFKCEEKYLYDWEWGDYCGNNPTMVFVVYADSYCAELYDECDYKGFCWKNKSIKELVESYNY